MKNEAITRDWNWWAYQFRVVHRQGIEGIGAWDDRLVAFIVHALNLRPGERVLDLACGSGVHALRLARRGIAVVGLDIAPSLVRYCTAQAAAAGLDNVAFVEGDMRALVYRDAFDAAVVLSTSFGFFDDAINKRVLAGIVRALRPGGRLLLQLLAPAIFFDRMERHTYREERPEGVYWTETWFDPGRSVVHSLFRLEDRDGVTHLWGDHERIRLYTAAELRRLFDQVGLRLTAVYGDVTLPPRPYVPERSREMVVVGERPPATTGRR